MTEVNWCDQIRIWVMASLTQLIQRERMVEIFAFDVRLSQTSCHILHLGQICAHNHDRSSHSTVRIQQFFCGTMKIKLFDIFNDIWSKRTKEISRFIWKCRRKTYQSNRWFSHLTWQIQSQRCIRHIMLPRMVFYRQLKALVFWFDHKFDSKSGDMSARWRLPVKVVQRLRDDGRKVKK